MNVSRTLVMILLCTGIAGCGSGLIKPRGRIVEKGATFQGQKGDHFKIVFHELIDNEKKPINSYLATVLPANTFQINGHQGKGIPPGKYRISVEITNRRGENDRLNGAFGPETSPFIQELKDDDQEIVLDIGQTPG